MAKFGLTRHQWQSICQVLKQYKSIDKAIIYGSRALGNFKKGSDIDLTLVGESIDFSQLCQISNQLDDLLLVYQFDLSLLKDIDNPNLQQHIQKFGKVLYQKSDEKQ